MWVTRHNLIRQGGRGLAVAGAGALMLAIVCACAAAPENPAKGPTLFPVRQNGKAGFIDETGAGAIEARFDYAYPFSQGLAAVGVNGKLGYIDTTGKLVIEPRYDIVPCGDDVSFADGWAIVGIDRKPHFIDPSGKIMPLDASVRPAGGFSEGRASVAVGNKCGFIDETGVMVVKPQFQHRTRFSEGLAPVITLEWDRYGYIDRTGNVVIQPKFAVAGGFSEGLAPVMLPEELETWTEPSAPGTVFSGRRSGPTNNRWVYIDKLGTVTINGRFTSAGAFSGGRAVVVTADGGQVLIDRTGKTVAKIPVDAVETFSEGLAVAHVGGRFGYVDRDLKTVIEPQFDAAGAFTNGLASVRLGQSWGYIDRHGRYVWAPTQ